MASKKDEGAVVTLNGKQYDLSKAFPLTVGDWEDLFEAGLMDGDQLKANSPKQIIDLIHILIRKTDDGLLREDIRAIPMNEMTRIIGPLQSLVSKESTVDENPTASRSSTPRTSSVEPTDGP